MRTFRLSTPKSNVLHTAADGGASYKATNCDNEYDHLSTGEPITLNFQALGLNCDNQTNVDTTPKLGVEIAVEDDRSSLGGSRRNDLIEDEAGGGKSRNSPTRSRRHTVVDPV
jgi:hypothetical protein